MSKKLSRTLSLFLALLLALPLSSLCALGVWAEDPAPVKDPTSGSVAVPYLENTTDVKYIAYGSKSTTLTGVYIPAVEGSYESAVAGSGGLDKPYKYPKAAFAALPNGGTLVIAGKGYIENTGAKFEQMVASSGTILVTAHDPSDGSAYYTTVASGLYAGDNQQGMMMANGRNWVLNSDVILENLGFVARASKNDNVEITAGHTLLIGENVFCRQEKTTFQMANVTVDEGAVAILETAGMNAYYGKGTIYLKKSAVLDNGSVIQSVLNKFNTFEGALYLYDEIDEATHTLSPEASCSVTGQHSYAVTLVDHEYRNVCATCGHDNGLYECTVPTVTSDAYVYWAFTGKDTNDGLSEATAVASATSGFVKKINEQGGSGTVYISQKGLIGANYTVNFSGPVLYTAIMPNGTDKRGSGSTYDVGALFASSSPSTAFAVSWTSDVIYKSINMAMRATTMDQVMTYSGGCTAVFDDVIFTHPSSSTRDVTLNIDTGSTVIMYGNCTGGPQAITGNGTLIIDPSLVTFGQITPEKLANFTGTVMTTGSKEVCKLTGSHNYDENGICTICGEEQLIISAVYVSQSKIGNGMTSDAPTTLSDALALDLDNDYEIIFVDDITYTTGTTLPAFTQNVRVNGNGHKLTLSGSGYLNFLNSGKEKTISFADLEIVNARAENITCSFFFNHNNITIEDTVTTSLGGDANKYPTIVGGYVEAVGDDTVAAKSYDKDAVIAIAGGTWEKVLGGNRSEGGKALANNSGNITVNITGGRFVGDAYGLSLIGSGDSFMSGDVTLNLFGGYFEASVYGAGFNMGADYGGTTPFDPEHHAFTGDVTINIDGAEFGAGAVIGALVPNNKIPVLFRGDATVDVTSFDGDRLTVDLRNTVAYSGESKASRLICGNSEYLGRITYRYVDYVNGKATGAGEPTRYAFVGDSITQGTGSSSNLTKSYPALIGIALGDEYTVGNFGVGASGALPSTRYYYPDTLKYALLMEEFEPELVYAMLGTNDATAAGGVLGVAQDFKVQYQEQLDGILSLDSVERLIVATPIHRNDEGPAMRNAAVIYPAIREIVSELSAAYDDKTVQLCDLYALTYQDCVDGKILGTDGLHPNDAGYALIAPVTLDAINNQVLSADNFYTDVVYLSDDGDNANDGLTAETPFKTLSAAFGHLTGNATIYLAGNYSTTAVIGTPMGLDSLTIRSVAGEKFTLNHGTSANNIRMGCDLTLDNLILASNNDVFACWYHDLTIGSDVEFLLPEGGTAPVVIAGIQAYENAATKEKSTTTYDSVESASSDKDVNITLNGGTYTAIYGGNSRTSGKAPYGTYSGNMVITLNDVTLKANSSSVTAVLGMNYLTGTIIFNLGNTVVANGAIYAARRTGTISSPIVYDASLSTGSVVINATTHEQIAAIVGNETASGGAQSAMFENYVINEPAPVAGDLNNNGVLDNSDITMFLQYMAHWTVDGIHLDVADINNDGKLNNRDIILMIRKLAGFDD